MFANVPTLRRSLWIGAAAAILLAVAHYTAVVLQARRATPEIVASLLGSGDVRLQLSDFSDERLRALLAVEDPAFYAHNGMDLSTPGGGITTITQGMVKYLYFERFRPGIAKLRQTLIAVFALDALVDKDTQLLIFVNTARLGSHEAEPVRGFADAAEAYFGKPFAALDDDEYLALVAMVIAPGTFHALEHPESNARRVARIKQLLAGDYTPKGLMDVYYGQLDEREQQGIAAVSYFPDRAGSS